MATIVIIGAGSVEFTRNVLADLCSYEELHGSLTIRLHDVDPDRLSLADAVVRKIEEKWSTGYTLESHLDRRAAFDGADYLIDEIQVGGYKATMTDFEIPERYGVHQTIADTLGIGGVMRGLRTIPVVIQMGNELAELSPNALFLNYTNPMAMVPWGMYAGSRFTNVVGLCHSVRDTHEFLAETVGIRQEDIRFQTAGYNHQCFVYRFEDRRTGEDLYPRLRAIVDADRDGFGRRVRVEIFKRFGYFPTESSEHSSEYVPWFLRHKEEVDRFRILIGDYIGRSQENLDELDEMRRAVEQDLPIDVEPQSELASEVIHSMETGKPREVYGNVRNGGLVEGLPEDSCVEVPCLVDKNGVQPTRIGEIPPQTLSLNRTFVNVVELTVQAAIQQSRDLVYQAALMDPNTAATLTTSQIVELVDELIEAHGDLIPEPIRRG